MVARHSLNLFLERSGLLDSFGCRHHALLSRARPGRLEVATATASWQALRLILLPMACVGLMAATDARAQAQSASMLAPAASAGSEDAAGVGQVSLVIGHAQISRKGQAMERVTHGMKVYVGDRIQTSGNGHVHLRFIDNAALALRPVSALEIQAYRFDAAAPAASEVRLLVDHGTGRSISGRATEVDKNRFRLNTPLAAIGVRGTDFIVRASGSDMSASVVEGTIVVDALGEGCSAAALGPCSGSGSQQLSGDTPNLMIELQRGEQVVRLVPVSDVLMASTASAPPDRAAAQRSAEAAARNAGLAAAEPYGTNDRAAAAVLVLATESLPDPDWNRRPSGSSQLLWGRYSISELPNDSVSVPYAIARLGRKETVGTRDVTLFRDETAGAFKADASLGAVDFRLTRGQATYQNAGATEAASITGGTLQIDFARETFRTVLGLSAPSAGSTEFRMAGDIRSNGTFSVVDTGKSMTGAISVNAQEAGYLFEQVLGSGTFRGLTLWGR